MGGFGDATVHFTFVYDKCSYILRRHLWHDLINISAAISGPWVVAGDFTVIGSNEKSFGSIPPSLPSHEFGDMIVDCVLYDLLLVGSPYTWCRSSSSPL